MRVIYDDPLTPEDLEQYHRNPMVWDTATTFPDGTVVRTKGNAVMISTPLRDDGPLSSVDHHKG